MNFHPFELFHTQKEWQFKLTILDDGALCHAKNIKVLASQLFGLLCINSKADAEDVESVSNEIIVLVKISNIINRCREL